jgi:hypothetical protein
LLLAPLSFEVVQGETVTHIQNDTEIQQREINFVYVGGKSTLMGCSAGVHLSPFWFQTQTQWVSYGFNGPTVIVINGHPMFYDEHVRMYMEVFKGMAPGSLHWAAKSCIGARIRLMGICTHFEIHNHLS